MLQLLEGAAKAWTILDFCALSVHSAATPNILNETRILLCATDCRVYEPRAAEP